MDRDDDDIFDDTEVREDNPRIRRNVETHDNDFEPQNQRRRNIDGFILPEPFSNTPTSQSSIRHTNVVSLGILTDPEAEPSMVLALNVQILRIIVHNPTVQNGSNVQAYSRSRYGPIRPSSMPYTRLLLCRIYSESEGNLLVYLMESPSLNKNTNLWLNNVELRDNGVITVGTIMRIISPLPVSSYLRGDIPLIETQHPAIVLKNPRTYLEVLPLENLQGESSRAFVLNGAILSCSAYSCERTKCGGSFCDRQRLNEWNTPLGTCGCYAQRTRGTNNLTLLYPLVKATHEGRNFNHSNFSSTAFTTTFLNQNFPIGVQANDLQLSEAYWMLGDTLQDIIQFINDNGGWTVVGWYSRGVINDRTLTGMIQSTTTSTTTSNQNNPEIQVDGADLTFHFCKILPTDSTYLDSNTFNGRRLEQMKFDVNSIHSV